MPATPRVSDERLWATPLEEQRRRDEEAARATPQPEPAPLPPDPEPQPQPAPEALALRPVLVVLVPLVALVVALAALMSDRGTVLVRDVPSFWGSIEMRCHTVRGERDGEAAELFRCRATDGATLPAGVYGPPRDSWTSDITRLPARDSRMRITAGGVLTGWAFY